MICGAAGGCSFERQNFKYRSSSYLTRFFLHCDMEDKVHDGSTRHGWVLDVLDELNSGLVSNPQLPSDGVIRVVQELMDVDNFSSNDLNRESALEDLNIIFGRDGLQGYFDGAGRCHLRILRTEFINVAHPIQGRAWTEAEFEKRKSLSDYLEFASEDDLIEQILQPVFQQPGFVRVSVSGHRDKTLEYGKNIWMKYQLPTSHFLYIGIQVERTKIDSAGKSKNTNVAEILDPINMILGHPIWNPETNRQNLVDHVYIISAAEITIQSKNWLGNSLDI